MHIVTGNLKVKVSSINNSGFRLGFAKPKLLLQIKDTDISNNQSKLEANT